MDIGGTGIKAGIVDLDAGALASDRVKVATPAGAEPAGCARRRARRCSTSSAYRDATIPLGVAFPAIVKRGRTLSAANVSEQWIDFPAEEFFEEGLGREIHFANDADVAGVAELRYGAAKGQEGLTILTTLGTGIGSAMIYDGVLVPELASSATCSARSTEGMPRPTPPTRRWSARSYLGAVGRAAAVVLQPHRVPVQPRPVRRRRRSVEARRPSSCRCWT